MKRTVMIKAWAKVRAMKAEGYTGSTSLMLSVAMKAAWAEVKGMEETSSIDVNSLPALQGSEKQIAWATEIRENFVKKLNRKIAEIDLDYAEFESACYKGVGAVRHHHKYDATFIAYNQLREVYKSDREVEEHLDNFRYTSAMAEREARKKAKENGLSRDDIKKTAKNAWFSKLKEFYVKMCVDSLMSNESRKASIWIDAYKNDELY